jgi:hypothetical protein
MTRREFRVSGDGPEALQKALPNVWSYRVLGPWASLHVIVWIAVDLRGDHRYDLPAYSLPSSSNVVSCGRVANPGTLFLWMVIRGGLRVSGGGWLGRLTLASAMNTVMCQYDHTLGRACGPRDVPRYLSSKFRSPAVHREMQESTREYAAKLLCHPAGHLTRLTERASVKVRV